MDTPSQPSTPAAPSRRGRRSLRAAGLGAGLLLGGALVLLLVLVHVTSQPSFCGTCHIMRPYYASWAASTHKDVGCVECHIAPGAAAKAKKKFEALSMVAKYVTRTYGTRIWTEVDDASCLRCHQRDALTKVASFHGVPFDHRPHLADARNGLRLRCTTCHTQIVQGAHIAVAVSTCTQCHLAESTRHTELGSCTTCHTSPTKVVTAGGTRFDHAEVARRNMDCRQCHESVVRGDGAVPPQNCLSCHSEPDRLRRVTDVDSLHAVHVSRRKVDCQRCHLLIAHDKGLPPARPVAGSCASCHAGGHSPQFQLYAGTGARGVPPMPSAMYDVGVTCQACHDHARGTQMASFPPAHTARVAEAACVACHGSGYGDILHAWSAGTRARTASLGRQMDATAGVMGAHPPAAWTDAKANLLLVQEGNGVHNVAYAYAVLEKAHEQMNAARAERRLAPLPRPWPQVKGGGECFSCHAGSETQVGAFDGRTFSHAAHLSAGLACAACHRPHAERATHEVVSFGAQGCASCHHSEKQAPVAEAACTRCHADVRTRSVPSARGAFSHAQHLEVGLECASCHTMKAGDPKPAASACVDCHDK